MGPSDSTAQDITKAPNGIGLETHSSVLGGRKSRVILRGDILEGFLAKCNLQRDILLPLLCCLVVDEVIKGLNGNGCYTLGMHYPHEWKIPKYCPTASSGGFEYGKTVVRYNSDINPSTKVSAAGSISY